MNDLSKYNRLLDEGFSLITVGSDKIPNIKWKKYQTKPPTKDEFNELYDLPTTDNVGLVTGYSDVEVIDIDLKVFSTAKEQINFWNEYLSFLEDNILDFNEKFVIYKTKNAGYHILYKSKRVQGNTKLAKLKGHKEAIIETRGVGGYVFIYEGKNQSELTYKDIDYISDEDREILWECSKTYNYIEETPIKEVKEIKDYPSSELTPWEDYNNNTSTIDLISNEFEVVRNLNDKYIIKRFGASSPHSGYIYKDSNCMYLFSTGTNYPHEKLLSPYAIYTYQKHNGNFSESAKDLYLKGFGERKKPKNVLKEVEVLDKYIEFPIEVFPEQIQRYISECNRTLNSSIDYMSCSMLWLTSIIIGNSLIIEVKKGWTETANIWLALIGKAGIGKTPSINNITFPLSKMNSREIKKYIKEYGRFEEYRSLDKLDQDLTEKVNKPRKTQFIVNDITLEALVDLHSENKNGVGVLKDELAGWFKDMNKYRQGSDLEHWLSSWSGKEINMNRKTAKSSFVERAFIPVMGGIQPSIMDEFYTDENKDNGFIDRMLFSFPDLEVEMYTEREMNDEYLEWWNDYLINFYQNIQKIINYTDDSEIEPLKCRMSDDAKLEWVRIFNEITTKQNSDLENEYMKSMLPKQKSYIPRFALLINSLNSYDNPDKYHLDEISKDSILSAEKLSKYFVKMSKKIKANSNEVKGIKSILKKSEDKNEYEKFVSIYEQNKKISKTKIADILGVSRQTIYNYIKEYDSTN